MAYPQDGNTSNILVVSYLIPSSRHIGSRQSSTNSGGLFMALTSTKSFLSSSLSVFSGPSITASAALISPAISSACLVTTSSCSWKREGSCSFVNRIQFFLQQKDHCSRHDQLFNLVWDLYV